MREKITPTITLAIEDSSRMNPPNVLEKLTFQGTE
jgi:hypothetical protein